MWIKLFDIQLFCIYKKVVVFENANDKSLVSEILVNNEILILFCVKFQIHNKIMILLCVIFCNFDFS